MVEFSLDSLSFYNPDGYKFKAIGWWFDAVTPDGVTAWQESTGWVQLGATGARWGRFEQADGETHFVPAKPVYGPGGKGILVPAGEGLHIEEARRIIEARAPRGRHGQPNGQYGVTSVTGRQFDQD